MSTPVFPGSASGVVFPCAATISETDPRVDIERCRQLGIRAILAAPIQYEREIIGLLEVFSTLPFAFDEGDVAVVERLAQTVVLTMSHASAFNSL
jgi:GAF domain-containing protein